MVPPGVALEDRGSRLALVVGSGRVVDRQVESFLKVFPDAIVFSWRSRPIAGRRPLSASSWRAVAEQLKAAGVTDVVHFGMMSPGDIVRHLFGGLGPILLKALGKRGGLIDDVMRPYAQALADAGVTPQSHSRLLPHYAVGAGLITPSNGQAEDVARYALLAGHVAPQAWFRLAERQPRFAVSQAVLFEGGRLVAQERRGTDALLLWAARRRPRAQRVLVKLRPPQQPVGLDPPVIGVRTIKNAAQARVSLIILDAKDGVILDRSDTLDTARSLGVSIVGV